MNLANHLRVNARRLQRTIEEIDRDEYGFTDWYKTYDVLYWDKDNHVKIIQAWPAYSESSGMIWTEVGTDRILKHEDLLLAIKHYEKEDKEKNNPV